MKNLYTAMIKANAEVKNLYPSSKGYGYNYIPLEKVIDEVKPIYAKHELSILQLPISENNEIGIENIIIHSSGESLSRKITVGHIQMKGANQIQADGAVFTYLRRYSIVSITGIAGDVDTDCQDTQKIPEKKETLPPKQTVGFTEWNEKREILFKMAVDYKDSLNDEERLFFSNLRKDITSKKPYSNDQFLKDRIFVENIINRLNEGASRAFDEPLQTSDEDKEPEFLLEDEKINDDLPLGVE